MIVLAAAGGMQIIYIHMRTKVHGMLYSLHVCAACACADVCRQSAGQQLTGACVCLDVQTFKQRMMVMTCRKEVDI